MSKKRPLSAISEGADDLENVSINLSVARDLKKKKEENILYTPNKTKGVPPEFKVEIEDLNP